MTWYTSDVLFARFMPIRDTNPALRLSEPWPFGAHEGGRSAVATGQHNFAGGSGRGRRGVFGESYRTDGSTVPTRASQTRAAIADFATAALVNTDGAWVTVFYGWSSVGGCRRRAHPAADAAVLLSEWRTVVTM